MARMVRFPEDGLESNGHELPDSMEGVISRVTLMLPAGFPTALADAVFDGMRSAKARFLAS